MKTNMNKKLLALLCAVSVALTSITFPFLTKANGGTETNFKKSEYKNWEQITFSNYGVADNTAYSGYNDFFCNTELADKVFNGEVDLSEGYYSHINMGNPFAETGFLITSNEGQVSFSILGGTAHQVDASVGTKFNLKLSYDVMDSNGDEVDDVLKFGVWINNKLYNGDYFEITDYSMLLDNWMGITANADDPIKVSSVVQLAFKDSIYTSWEQVTFANYGVADNNYSGLNDFFCDTTLQGKVFNGDVQLASTYYCHINMGNPFAETGFLLTSNEGQASFSILGGELHPIDVEAGKKFNLKLSYDVVDTNEDEEVDSLKLGVWINNELYDGKYFELADYSMLLDNWMGITANADDPVQVASVVDFNNSDYADWDQVTFSDYGINNDVYDNLKDGFYDTGLREKVFSGNVKFSSGYGHILIGDHIAESGLLIYSEEGKLYIPALGTAPLDPEIAGTKLIGEEFNLKLSYDMLDKDGNEEEDTLKLGVWINDKLYNNEYVEIQDYSLLLRTWLSIAGSSEGAITVKSEKKQVSAPIPFADSKYAEWDQISFSDYANLPDGTYDTVNGEDFSKIAFYDGTLAGKVFSGDVTFSGTTTYLTIGATSDPWNGLYLISNYEGDPTVLHLLAGGEHVITPEALGTEETTFAETPFNLKFSYELVDFDEDENPDSLKLGVWINNLLYKYIDIADYTEATGGGLGIFTPVAGSSVTLKSNKVQKAEPVYFADTEYKNWEKVTFDDFGLIDDTYAGAASLGFGGRGYYSGGSLEDKVFHGKVTLSENWSYLIIGGLDDPWQGIYVASNPETGQLEVLNHGAISTELAVPGKQFDLKLSYDIVEEAGTKSLKLGIWIENRLFADKYLTFTDYATLVGPLMSLYTEPEGSYIKTESVVSKLSGEQIKFADTKYNNWEQVTFSDFGFDDGTYSGEGIEKTGYYSASTLAGKVFSGNVKFSDKRSDIWIGSKGDMWNGIGLLAGYLDSQNLYLLAGGQQYKFSPKIVDTILTQNEFNLKLSYDVVEEGGSKFLKLGVWFDDKLYNNEYIMIGTWNDDNGNPHTYEEYIGTHLGFYTQFEDSYVKVGSIGTKTLSSRLKKITFTDFGIQDGTYTYVGDLAASGTYAGTLEGVVINGDVLFSSKPATLFVGGKSDVKQGLSLTSGSDGNLILKIGNDTYILTSDVAGAQLVGKSFNLQLSYQIDNDTLEFGVWINGKLYDNKYIYVSDNYTDYLTGRLAVYPEAEGASLQLVSEKAEVLNKYLEKITFADYGIADGTYSGEDNMKVGYYMGGYDDKVFSGDVTFSEYRTDIWIGGQESAWQGMGILSGYEGDTTTLRLMVDGREYIFTPEIAGTTLVGKSVNLKLSYELVDNDNDGKKDVLKLGVWFNNKLYNNQYIYVTNYEQYMGPYIGLYTALADSRITVASDLTVDYVALGSRRAPSPNTGDEASVVLYLGLAILAAVIMVVLGKKQRLE